MTDERSRRAVEVAERYADGLYSSHRLPQVYEAASTAAVGFPSESVQFAAGRAAADAARSYPPPVRGMLARAADAAAGAAAGASPAEPPLQADLLRDVVGPLPFRPVRIDPAWLESNDRIVVRVASAIYEERYLPSGHLDTARLAILADALEEAGATDEELLAHLRGPGPHVRGCFAVDAILGKP